VDWIQLAPDKIHCPAAFKQGNEPSGAEQLLKITWLGGSDCRGVEGEGGEDSEGCERITLLPDKEGNSLERDTFPQTT
jgi:hypothetical protein